MCQVAVSRGQISTVHAKDSCCSWLMPMRMGHLTLCAIRGEGKRSHVLAQDRIYSDTKGLLLGEDECDRGRVARDKGRVA